MKIDIADQRRQIIDKIMAKQDSSFRWGFNERQARERPEYIYYSPNFKSTLWTLVLLADLQAPAELPQIKSSLRLISSHFYDHEHGIFGFPEKSHFPIPCLNGNMIYLHHYFEMPQAESMERTIAFFDAHQRFDDGDFKTPKSYPYCGNTRCCGRHSCYWGVTKLLKGISFIPRHQRSQAAQQLIGKCIDFVLHHEVCFRSRSREQFLHRDIEPLTFPNFYKSDFLEILWLLSREGVHDRRISRALDLLRSKKQEGSQWVLEKSGNIVVPIGQTGSVNAFVTERAAKVMDFYGGG